MADDIIDLHSINWSQGMFLTPDHFLQQERYFDSALLWALRYATVTAGLIGGGPRVSVPDRGAASFDPVVDVDDSGDTVKIAITRCRGMTAAGGIVEVEPSHQLQAAFSKRELEGTVEFGVYVVVRPHDKEPDDAIKDPINTDLQAGRRLRHRISLDPAADEAPWSLLLIRLRRAQAGLRYERLEGFIPPCAFMSSHSALMHAFRQLNDRVARIADHYSRLHLAIIEFVTMARARQLPIEQDLETLGFANRMVVALEECAYRILDPLQPPRQFFQETNQLIRSAALFLSLSPPTAEYFRRLGDFGETEFVTMLEQEGEALEMGRRWLLNENLGIEAEKVDRALDRLDRLEQALEGKYMDYRVSPTLESLNFFFDRISGEPVLYKAVAKQTRPQAEGQELTFVFASLRLEGGRDQYRVILIGDPRAALPTGGVNTTRRINAGLGYDGNPEYTKSFYEVDGQRNFAVDFGAPENASTINDIRVSVPSGQSIRSAILYVRARLIDRGPRPVAPPLPPPKPVFRDDSNNRAGARPPIPGPPVTEPVPEPERLPRKRRIIE